MVPPAASLTGAVGAGCSATATPEHKHPGPNPLQTLGTLLLSGYNNAISQQQGMPEGNAPTEERGFPAARDTPVVLNFPTKTKIGCRPI